MPRLAYLLLLALCAAPLSAQVIADYAEKGNLYGTRNMTARYTPPVPPAVSAPAPDAVGEWWGDSVENDRWIITCWYELAAAGVEYKWRAYDKQTGYYTNYVSTANMIGSNAISGNTLDLVPLGGLSTNLTTLKQLKPSIAFTDSDGSANGYPGVVIAITGVDGITNNVDIFCYFLKIDPNTAPPMGTQPEWIVDTDRFRVNVSNSTGQSDYPCVESVSGGQFVVTWRDFTTAGTIGDQPNIFPQQPGNNPSNLAAVDIYSRRMQQQFNAAGSPGPGAVDGAVPSSTVNVSSSLGFENHLDTAGNGTSQVYVAFCVSSAQSDAVAGLGANSGPIGGAFGAEKSDTYLRIITTNGTNDLSPSAALNMTESSGDSFGVNCNVEYNASNNQIGLLFFDDTTAGTGGIGGNASLSAVEQGMAPNTVPQYDVFCRVVRSDLSNINTTAVTQSSLLELFGDIAAFGQNGFIVGYSVRTTSGTTIDIRSFHARVDGTGKLTGTAAQYPRQPVIPNGGVPTTAIFSISAFNNNSVSIVFVHLIDPNSGIQEGVPEHLRTTPTSLGIDPERPAATGSQDLFLTVGEPVAGNPAQGLIRIREFTINNGDPIDPMNPPVEIPVKVIIENASSNAGLQLDQVTVSPPPGFAEVGQGPPFPVVVFPSAQLTFNYSFTVSPLDLQPGSNIWDISAAGFIGGFPTLGTGDASVSVLGTEGTLVGVDIIAQFNPTVLTANTVQDIQVTIAVSNGGQETMRDLEIEGALTTGYLPSDLRFKIFSPIPRDAEIPAGSIQVFETTISTSVQLEDNVASPTGYRPAVTVSGEQSSGMAGGAIRSGSVTIQSQVGIRVDPQPDDEKALQQPLVNSGTAGSCSILGGSSNWILFAVVIAAGSLVAIRRRTA